MRREFYLLLVVDFFDITKNAQINFANYNLAKFFFFLSIYFSAGPILAVHPRKKQRFPKTQTNTFTNGNFIVNIL